MFQSTHPSRGATLNAMRCLHKERVSIHAPLAGCDSADFDQLLCLQSFNPRTPRGVRHIYSEYYILFGVFQSTHPSRGATQKGWFYIVTKTVSIHAPLAGCDPPTGATWDGFVVSIHAPLAGCDCCLLIGFSSKKSFNPRTPRGVRQGFNISVLPVESFNPRTPRGVRHFCLQFVYNLRKFQSTHPSRGATVRQGSVAVFIKFQSTHPSRGATRPLGSPS